MLETIRIFVPSAPDYFTDCDAAKDAGITPVRKGPLGINLNNQLQKILNPKSSSLVKTFGDRVFRENDKVMQIKIITSLRERLDDFTDGQGVFNGDVGFIQTIDKEFNEVTASLMMINMGHDFTQLDELELAYAVTVHKSQGSEFPIVIMPVSWFPPMLATRNLLYTAVTRGTKAVILVGSENKLQGMVENNRITDRYSGLCARMKMFLNGVGI